MVPLLAGVDLIGDYPVGDPAPVIVGIPLRQKGGNGRHVFHARLLRPVKHIVGSRAASPCLGMDQLLVSRGIIVQNDRSGSDPLPGKRAENNVVFRHHLSVQGISPSVIGILDGRVGGVGGRAKQPCHGDIISRLLDSQIVQLASCQS